MVARSTPRRARPRRVLDATISAAAARPPSVPTESCRSAPPATIRKGFPKTKFDREFRKKLLSAVAHHQDDFLDVPRVVKTAPSVGHTGLPATSSHSLSPARPCGCLGRGNNNGGVHDGGRELTRRRNGTKHKTPKGRSPGNQISQCARRCGPCSNHTATFPSLPGPRRSAHKLLAHLARNVASTWCCCPTPRETSSGEHRQDAPFNFNMLFHIEIGCHKKRPGATPGIGRRPTVTVKNNSVRDVAATAATALPPP